jgi:hypothetical protein
MPTPPVDMLVLDAVQDDVEQVPSIMRLLGEWRHRIDDEYVQADVVDALRRLLSEGFVAALEESRDAPELVPCADPGLLDSDLVTYWYGSTPSGRAKWDSWQRTVDY